MSPRAFISGCAGTVLSAGEKEFFRAKQPWGVILFARNCECPAQLSALCAEIRLALGRPNAPILIDQEGGRVQRLKPPRWSAYPAAGRLAAIYRSDHSAGLAAVRLAIGLMAADLGDAGINVNCLPVLDVPAQGSSNIIGDRAYGDDVADIVALSRVAADALFDGGLLPVMKHIPGHGRATVDSHQALPRVDAPLDALKSIDFAPFSALKNLPMAMTAHVVFGAVDAERPVTLSPVVIDNVIRNQIGFDGLLMSDDLSMGALRGSAGERARACLAAGCDIALHCNGDLGEMREVADAAGPLEGAARRRADAALGLLRRPARFDRRAARLLLQKLVGESVKIDPGDPTSP